MAMKSALRNRASVVAKASAVPPQKPVAKALPKSALVAGIASIAYAAPVVAAEAELDQVDSTISSLIAAVQSSGDILRSGLAAVDSGLKIAKEGYEVAAPYVESTIKAVTPVAEQALKATTEAAAPALKAGLPFVSDASAVVQTTLADPNVSLAVSTANKAVTLATPYVKEAATFVTTSDPVTLAEYGLAAVAAYYIAPPLLGAVAGSFKGYAGEVSAAQVLDAMNDGNTVLVDIRTTKEKEGSGVPDLPASASRRALEVELAVTEDKKLRNALRNPGAIEASVTCLQIASLKSVNKGTKIILMDRYGNISTSIAKELASKGFSKVYVLSGGFDGRGGWVQSKLQIKPAASIINAPAPPAKVGTFKALPSGR